MTTTKSLHVGTRVKVTIKNPSEYAHGCANCLEGLAGVVDEVSEVNYLGYRRESPYLVLFDAPAPKWWTNQTPAKAFWFPAKDLEALPCEK